MIKLTSKFLALSILLICSILFTNCSEDPIILDKMIDPIAGSMSATIEKSDSTIAFVSDVNAVRLTAMSGGIIVKALSPNEQGSFTLFIQSYTGTGTYVVGGLDNDINVASLTLENPFGYWETSDSETLGEINITADETSYIEGNFSFTAASFDDEVVIKNGTFKVGK